MGPDTLKRCDLSYSYPSWTQKYGYDGTNAYLRDLGVGGTLVLSTVSCLVLLYLADSLGRKTILLVSASLILIGLTFSVTIPNLMTKFFFIGFAAGAEGAFSALFTIMINENTRKVKFNRKFLQQKLEASSLPAASSLTGWGAS